MTNLPEEPVTSVEVTTRNTMELNADMIEAIILEWAKGRGFSHRATVDLDSYRCTITETVVETRDLKR